MLPAANSWLMVPQSRQEVRAERVVLPAEVVQELERGLRAVVVDRRRVGAVAVVLLDRPPRATVRRGELPAAGVVLRHLGVAGLAGLLGDRLRGLAHLVPRRGRAVGVEAGRLEERAVVVQAHRVGLAREAEDVAVVAGDAVEDDRVELVGVAELLDLLGDVHELTVLEQRLGVGERNREHVGQAAARELHGEGRALPLVLDADDVDVGVLVLELRLLRGEGLVGGGVGAGREGGDAKFGLAAVVPPPARAGDERADRRQRGDAGDRDSC